jgi:hypothetical protein
MDRASGDSRLITCSWAIRYQGVMNLLAQPLRLFIGPSVVLAAILVAGCGGGDKSSEPPQEVEEQLGLSLSGTGSMERQTQVEGRIRDCMSAQGFEYTPVDPFARQQAITGKARMSDEEFLKQFGYGISTLFGRGNTQSDPNDRIRKNLPAQDRAAYDRALGGDNPGVTFAEALDTGDFSELGGCTKQASEAAFGGGALLTALVGKLDELDERIVQDQRMVRATEKWAACMRDQGYRYEDSDQIDEDLLKRFQAIVGTGVRPGATVSPDPGISYDPAALAELKREEVKIANADLACEKREILPVERVVRPQYEQDFRSQNRKLLVRVPSVGQ